MSVTYENNLGEVIDSVVMSTFVFQGVMHYVVLNRIGQPVIINQDCLLTVELA